MTPERRKALNRLAVFLAGIAFLILLGTILLSYRDWQDFRAAGVETRHAREVLDAADTLLTAMLDAETGQRGFLLTGDTEYLAPYERALATISAQLQRLEAYESGEQHSQALLLRPQVTAKLAELKETIDTRMNQGSAAAMAIVRTNRGKQNMDRVRELCSQIVKEEDAALAGMSSAVEIQGQRTRFFTVFGSAILFLCLLAAGVVIASGATLREQLIDELRASEKQAAGVRDLLQTTLSSIGDAVIATDARGKVTFINPVAQNLTQYAQEQAAGRPLEEVFRIVNESSRATVESPVAKVLREGTIAGLANHTVLISRNGVETPIDDSGAPIRDPQGSIAGVVLVFRDITARKKAEEESLRLAAIVESSDDAIVAQRLDGVITSWNAAAGRMFGYTAAEIVGRDFSLLLPEGSKEDPAVVSEQIGRGERAVHYEALRRRKDGSLVEVAVVVSPIRNSSGLVIGASRICRDITERRLAEKARQRSNQHIAGILESIRDGFVALDAGWVFTYVNAEAEKLLGRPRSDLLGKNYWQVEPAALGKPAEEHLRRASAERVHIAFEEFNQELGGWFEASLYPAPDGGLSIYFRNINRRKQTLEALRESEERLRLSAEAAQIGLWTNDLVARRVTWSPELERLCGLEPGSFRGTNEHAAQLVHPEDRDRVMEALNHAVKRGDDFDLECRIERADGELRWIFVRGRPKYGDTGAAVSMSGVVIDITGRKRLEEKLRQSQKLESLGVLAGGVAHDFNNLLVGILGNAGVLMEATPEDSPLRQVVENLLQAGERAAHLTRQMLAYSGRGRFVVERLNLEQQVHQIVALIGASIPKGVRIKLDFEPGLPSIDGDAGQLQQLVMNLAINGAEAVGEAGGVVTISTRLREIDPGYIKDNLAGDSIPPGSYAVLEVHDTGIGMDAATQARIFDPFFTTKFTGRGLGLAAVQGIVRGHKGALTVYSEPGKGTTFKVFLPVAGAQEPAFIGQSPAPEIRGEGTILVVDDEEVILRTLATGLELYGFTILTASGGEQAIEILKTMHDRIALVLLDMTMPVVSGEETLRRLHAICPDLPVIATSGYNEVEALRRFGAGLSGFIQKPFTPRKLAEKIRSVLDSGQGPPVAG
jgi:two-component system cell cycle sensor histidine kinase/response regulator CckA